MIGKGVLGGLLMVLLLGSSLGLAKEVVPPAAAVEVAVLEDAFAQLTSFFRGFSLDIRDSLTVLSTRVDALERTTLVFQMGLEKLAERLMEQAGQLSGMGSRLTGIEQAIEGAVVPKIVALEGRVSALEKHDFASLERRLGALDQSFASLSIRIDHNRAKIAALEEALLVVSTATEERVAAVLADVESETAAQREEIEALRSEFAELAQGQQAQWTAIFLVPIAVGGLLYFLLAQGG